MTLLLKMNMFLLSNSPLIAAGLGQALGGAAGIVNAVALVAFFAGLVTALVLALSERHTGGIGTALVISAVGGCAWVIMQTCFQVGGQQTNITMQPVN